MYSATLKKGHQIGRPGLHLYALGLLTFLVQLERLFEKVTFLQSQCQLPHGSRRVLTMPTVEHVKQHLIHSGMTFGSKCINYIQLLR